ncbi:MAG: polyribonucleotide nucleotidyltransferase [Chloroflexi bacterium]|nr:polyribonucleotide nucleotidyltransferase [Chloroflexota bacterium]
MESVKSDSRPKIFSVEREIAGRKMVLQTGKVAKQSGGAVICSYADTVVLCTATAAYKAKEGADFFPLLVDYEEKMYAGGKIPGGFFKREGRPPEKSILTMRLIDRPIRPLFPEGFRHDVQVVAMALSSDNENDTDIPALIGASAALTLSDIPFPEPIAASRIGRINGELIVNPTYQQLGESDLNLILASTKDNIMMVEAGSDEIPEKDMLEAFKLAQDINRQIIEMIVELSEKCGKEKREFPLAVPDLDMEAFARKYLTEKIREIMRMHDKHEREKAFEDLEKEALAIAAVKLEGSEKERIMEIMSEEKSHDIAVIIKKIGEEVLRTMIVDEGVRPDGRTPTEIRPLSSEVGLLPRTHGSALFTRGETQVLNIATLGTLSDEQIIDGLGIEETKRYMHHYDFLPFSVGEVRPMRGPGRREIGHGALAERALIPVLPSEEEFPYTLRLVSEVLESNGSTSMASTCSSSLSLMDAGVPIKKAVAGIAMGLILKDDRHVILSDIQGVEDALGEMDFKVAGTKDGITALQMDIKVKGISYDILEKALHQAKEGRLFILDHMNSVLSEPRAELSPYAPRIITIHIDPEKIRDVIGTGGKVINKIIADTGVKIDIEQDGSVYIAGVDPKAVEAAKTIIEEITREVEVGEVYMGKVTRIMSFGAVVEIFPGRDGLLHISQMSKRHVDKVEDMLKMDDEVLVRVKEVDPTGKISLTRIGLVPGEEDLPDERESRPPRSGGFGGRGGGSRRPYNRR